MESNENERILSIGAIVWCWLCLIANGIFALVVINDTSVVLNPGYTICTSLIAMVGYIFLLCESRKGFYILCCLATVTVIVGLLSMNLSALLGVINPIITWAALKSSWDKLD